MTRTVYRGAALADGTGPELVRDVCLLVEDDRIVSIGPAEEEPAAGASVIDATLRAAALPAVPSPRGRRGEAVRARLG